MSAMVDSTGTRFHFSVAAGVAEVVELEFHLSGGAEVVDFTDAVLECEVRSRVYEDVVSVPVEHGTAKGLVLLNVPKLAASGYDYTLVARSESGEERVLLYGVLSALDLGAVGDVEAGTGERRRLCCVMPEEEGLPLEVSWKASSIAKLAAAEAAADAVVAKAAAAEASAAMERIEELSEAIAGAAVDKCLKRVMVDRVSDLPSEGVTCNGWFLYYVKNVVDRPEKHVLYDGGIVYCCIEHQPPYSSWSITVWSPNGVIDNYTSEVYTDDVVAEINAWDPAVVKAEKVSDKVIKLTSLSSTVLFVDGDGGSSYLSMTAEVDVYAWFEGEGWKVV